MPIAQSELHLDLLRLAGAQETASTLTFAQRQAIIDAMATVETGIWVLDEHGKTVAINPAAERLSGWGAADIIGKVSHNIIHHSYADGSLYPILQCPIYASVFYTKPAHIEGEVFWRKDRSSFAVEYVTLPVVLDGGERGGAVQHFRAV